MTYLFVYICLSDSEVIWFDVLVSDQSSALLHVLHINYVSDQTSGLSERLSWDCCDVSMCWRCSVGDAVGCCSSDADTVVCIQPWPTTSCALLWRRGDSRPKYVWGPRPSLSSLPLQSLPASSLPFPSPPSSLLPSFPLEVGLLKYSQGVWGSAVSSPSGVWSGAPAEIEFCAF